MELDSTPVVTNRQAHGSPLPMPNERKVDYIKRLRSEQNLSLYVAKQLADAIFSEVPYSQRVVLSAFVGEMEETLAQTHTIRHWLFTSADNRNLPARQEQAMSLLLDKVDRLIQDMGAIINEARS